MRRSIGAVQAIAVVTTVISAMAILLGLDQAIAFAGFIPARIAGGLDVPGALPWILTPWTAELLHGSWIHLAINMVMLLIVGPKVERIVGLQAFIFVYVIGALAAAAAQFAIDPMSPVPMVGASGAISTVFGLFSLFYGRPPQVSGNQKINRAVHVMWLLAAWIVINIGTAYIAGMDGMLLATPAHVGGFAVGLLLQRPLLLWRYRDA